MWKCRRTRPHADARRIVPTHFHIFVEEIRITFATALNFFEVHVLAVVLLENLAALLRGVVAAGLLLTTSASTLRSRIDRVEIVGRTLLAKRSISAALTIIAAEAVERLTTLFQTEEDEDIIDDDSCKSHDKEYAGKEEHK